MVSELEIPVAGSVGTQKGLEVSVQRTVIDNAVNIDDRRSLHGGSKGIPLIDIVLTNIHDRLSC